MRILRLSLLRQFFLLSKKSYSPDIFFIANGTNIKCLITNKMDPRLTFIHNTSAIEFTIGKTKDRYTAFFKTENFKMMSDDYDVVISKQKVSHFINRNKKIEYWVVLEPSSQLSDKGNLIDDIENKMNKLHKGNLIDDIENKINKLYQQREKILNDSEI